jgi:Protein of unknown function (DUF3641)
MPISRYLDYLVASGNLEHYMTRLVTAFNPQAALGAMCRSMLSVGWEGSIYDCDFNQMLGLRVAAEQRHIDSYQEEALQKRNIVTKQHCYGCTAGSGSSCGGATA